MNDNNDIWNNALTDPAFLINNKIARIFPKMKNHKKYSDIKIDDESLTYITIREIAETTSKIVIQYLLQHNMNPHFVNIADFTAGVGGNVLSFCKYFQHVYAIEIDKLRAEYLLNNINIYENNNITVENQSCIEYNNKIENMELNVVFIDPPWGGGLYKNFKELQIVLKDDNTKISLEDFIISIITNLSKSTYNNKFPCYKHKFIFLKLPLNYNINFLYEKINKYCTTIDAHIIQKMLIIAICL